MVDLLRWGLDVDYPTKVSSNGGRFRYKDDRETPDTQVISYDFKEEISMSWEGAFNEDISTALLDHDLPEDLLLFVGGVHGSFNVKYSLEILNFNSYFIFNVFMISSL